MIIKPPQLPRSVVRVLSSLPLEDQIDSVLSAAAKKAEKALSPLQKALDSLPTLEGFTLPTPLGEVSLPSLEPPNIFPQITPKRRESVKAAVGSDLGSLIGVVPVVGDVLGNAVNDIYGARLRELLEPEEYRDFLEKNKVGPSTLAILWTFGKGKRLR